jgi:hypothetical protein
MRLRAGLFLIAVCIGCKEKSGDGRSTTPAPAANVDSAGASEAARKPLAPQTESIPPAPTSEPVDSSNDLRMIAGYAYGKDSLTLEFEGRDNHKPGRYPYLALSGNGSSVWLDTVWVEIKNDSVSSFYSGQSIGTVVSMAMAPHQLACFDASMRLKPGPLKTWYLEKAWSDRPAEPPESAPVSVSTKRKTLDLAGLGKTEFYLTFAAGPDTTEYGELNLERPFHWNLKIGSEAAVAFPTVSEPWANPVYSSADDALLWIGDLDRDGNPDVLLSPVLGPYPGGRLYQLFLSRDRVAGKEWRAAAMFSYYPPGMGD